MVEKFIPTHLTNFQNVTAEEILCSPLEVKDRKELVKCWQQKYIGTTIFVGVATLIRY